MTSSSPVKDKCFHEESSQLIVFTPRISSDCSDINFSNMSKICFIKKSFSVFCMDCQFSNKFLVMNTDSCTGEDTNILHIKECLFLSCF